MRARRLGPVAAAAFVVACYGSEPVGYDFAGEEGDGELGVWLHSGLFNRAYELHIPEGLDNGGRHPLIIFLHGDGDTGPGFRRRLKADAATDAAGFITVWPTGMEGSWTIGCPGCTVAEELGAEDDVFLESLIRTLADQVSVDTSRVYVAGFSQGGQLAQVLACKGRFQLAGMAVVGAMLFKDVGRDCAPKGRFPVGILHGDQDPIALFFGFGPEARVYSVPETVEFWLDLWGCTGDPIAEFIPHPGGEFTAAGVFSFPGCGEGGSVTFYRVYEGGHTWPGNTGPWPVEAGPRSTNIDATARFIDLFTPGAGAAVLR